MVPGGSACNTVMGVVQLGGAGRFVGKRGKDDFGRQYEAGLREQGVDPFLFSSGTPTGLCLSVITPDNQRTMFTCLGASAEILPEEMAPVCFKNAAVAHVEGYLLFNEKLIKAVMDAAKQSGALISLDLASFTVVEENISVLNDLVAEYVDILFANEDEARAFTGFSESRSAIEALSRKAELAVLKVGAHGSFVAHEGNIISIDPVGGAPIQDTTGAGDLYAAGFLYGLINKMELEQCGFLGSMCGFEVCRVLGARILKDGWERIHKAMNTAT
jgi:sugar/nucleoside kinase (ribokinase family)